MGRFSLRLMLTGGLLLLVGACAPGRSPSPAPSPQVSPSPRPSPTPSPALPTAAPRPSPALSPTSPPLPASPALPPVFPLRLPVPSAAEGSVAPNYRFGTDMGGEREIHHGVEFENPAGTPVLAAAEGVVRFAGVDSAGELAPWPDFYGLTVVLEHTPLDGMPFFTLYAHLSEARVAVGERLQEGEVIGLVGMSGSAAGPHLHFEVRLGGNDYAHSSNPEVWLQPRVGCGALAGRIADGQGRLVPALPLTLLRMDAPEAPPQYFQTYEADERLPSPVLEENFALGNLPAGRYRLEFILDGLQRAEIVIHPGERTFFAWKGGP